MPKTQNPKPSNLGIRVQCALLRESRWGLRGIPGIEVWGSGGGVGVLEVQGLKIQDFGFSAQERCLS